MNDLPLAADGTIRVWYRSTSDIDEAETTQLIKSLPPDERERCLAFRFARDRRDYSAAHTLLRAVLSRYADTAPSQWTFEANVYGKPAIAPVHGSNLTFNLSHTHGLVACAVTRTTSIGIDVESINRTATGREIAAHYFSPTEIRALEAVPPDLYQQRFIEIWTLKESYIKAVGLGLSHALDTFSFVLSGEGTIQFTPPPEAPLRNRHFHLCEPVSGYRLALAMESTEEPTASYTITLHNYDHFPNIHRNKSKAK